jgi:hypothetical protein
LRRLFELDPLDESEVEFSYSVSWVPTDITFRQRYKLQGEPHARQDLEIHWLSIMNSFLLVILLVGFILLVINRILNRDYSRYEKSSLEDGMCFFRPSSGLGALALQSSSLSARVCRH